MDNVTNWPQAFAYVGTGLVGLGLVLAYWTDFWENLFNRDGVRRVEVVPQSLLNDVTEVVIEMRQFAREGGLNAKKVADWAKRISEAMENEEE